MTALSWMLISVYAALAHAEQGVIVEGPLLFEPVPALARLSPDQLARAKAVWVWSPLREPSRRIPEELRKERPRFGTGRTILVRVPAARQMPDAQLRLIAAPAEMWDEVPEPLLPSWPVPRSGRLTIPTDSSRKWRLRVAGETAGSFWTDLPAGAAGAVLAVLPAPGAHFAVVGEGERTVAGSSVRVLESSLGRAGGAKAWVFLIGDESGRFALPGLPDRSELIWLASGQGHPPKRVVSMPNRLKRIVLAEGAAVTGRLVDAGGRPLAGASAQVETWVSSEAPIPLIVKAETDARGRFVANAVPPGKAMLVAVNSGWASFHQSIEVPAEGLNVGNLALSRGDSLAVRVMNDAGDPIAGAEIRPDLGEAATTGPDGSAILNHLAERTVRVVATAQGHLQADKLVEVPAGGPLELQLQRAFAVTGRFVGADGEPLAEAAVKMTRGRSYDSAPLEPDGSFSLALRPAQEYTLTFTSPQSASLEISVPEGGPGEERDLGELNAPATAAVVGRLVDGATGDPVPGARVWCPRPSGQGPLVAWMSRDLLETSSGADGTFRLQGVPPGQVTLRIEASGFARTRHGAGVPSEGSADLGDIPLSRGTVLLVTAGPSGKGATAAVDPGAEGLPFDRLTAPILEGVGRVEQVPAGPARVSVMRNASILCETPVQVPPAAGELLVECSAEGMRVRGAVTLGGRPAEAGTLMWQTEAGPVPEGIMSFKTASGLTQQQVFTANAPPAVVPVEAGGAFVSGELRAGRWQVTFQPDRGGSTEALEVVLSAEKEQTVVLPYPGFSIIGTVLDADGQIVEGARVREVEGGTTILSAADGSFRFEGLRAKTYFFSAAKDEAASETLEVAVGDGQPLEPLVLVLRPEGRRPALEVRVADERGTPVAGAFVFVELPGRGVRVLTADSSGVAKLLLDPPYPETVRAAARIGMTWVLGSWQPFDRARNGLALSPGPTGSLGLVVGESQGLLQISAPGDWNLTLLLGTLGAPPLLEQGAVLESVGLPVGTYELRSGERVARATVREGERTEVGWEAPIQ